jgi:hypothetical protein
MIHPGPSPISALGHNRQNNTPDLPAAPALIAPNTAAKRCGLYSFPWSTARPQSSGTSRLHPHQQNHSRAKIQNRSQEEKHQSRTTRATSVNLPSLKRLTVPAAHSQAPKRQNFRGSPSDVSTQCAAAQSRRASARALRAASMASGTWSCATAASGKSARVWYPRGRRTRYGRQKEAGPLETSWRRWTISTWGGGNHENHFTVVWVLKQRDGASC